MNSLQNLNMTPGMILFAGLIQLGLFIWIITFPIVIIKKLNHLIVLLKNK